jgi:hypothetical protein
MVFMGEWPLSFAVGKTPRFFYGGMAFTFCRWQNFTLFLKGPWSFYRG